MVKGNLLLKLKVLPSGIGLIGGILAGPALLGGGVFFYYWLINKKFPIDSILGWVFTGIIGVVVVTRIVATWIGNPKPIALLKIGYVSGCFVIFMWPAFFPEAGRNLLKSIIEFIDFLLPLALLVGFIVLAIYCYSFIQRIENNYRNRQPSKSSD